jgi:hypothetical protein
MLNLIRYLGKSFIVQQGVERPEPHVRTWGCGGNGLSDDKLSAWTRVTRRLDITLDQLDERVGLSSCPDPVVYLQELHEAFSGELLINGWLCYKEDKEILRPLIVSDGLSRLCWHEERGQNL